MLNPEWGKGNLFPMYFLENSTVSGWLVLNTGTVASHFVFLFLAGSTFLILAQCEKNFRHTYKFTVRMISRNAVPWELHTMNNIENQGILTVFPPGHTHPPCIKNSQTYFPESMTGGSL